MMPVSFSDQEIDMLFTLAGALSPGQRDAFLQIVSDKLAAHPQEVRGPGLLHRIASQAQKDFLKGGPVAVGKAKQPRSSNSLNNFQRQRR